MTRQASLLSLVADDDRPLNVWVASMLKLAPRVYSADAALAAEFETAIRRLGQVDFACIRVDHPSAPLPDAPARDALAFLLQDNEKLRTNLNH